MKILVLGGTNFFGKKAVQLLLDHGHQVTIATRGNKKNPFVGRTSHILLDVEQEDHSGWKEVQAQRWDAVFNNICYTREEAERMLEVLRGLTDRVYFTSSMAVYGDQIGGFHEEDFDPMTYIIDPTIEITYGEGKRQVESVLFKQNDFKVTAFRFPIVLDDDDYTQRLHHYIDKALKNEVIEVYNLDAHVNYIKGTMAADFIVWAIENAIEGILNISSNQSVPFSQIISWLEEAVGHQLQVVVKDEIDYAPLSTRHDQYVVPDKAENLGFQINPLAEWMPDLMKRLTKERSR
ncbi:NAD-dependent epimerase/dehydratase family protein [Facklamia sp. DSM 111018]|uniref:NAD-dependent epimerase/dehydratase family protein n=1 Tax=Facklamia lactis TaxID=2749967 RepID=A0ABS0LPU8_9LACT|nr:NAD-dependent epimerase/dehydratase family protein [Facklamia lactis]MBG9986173.1 NAD-dependent epimerase/dehydratase family protein [Facklamia lactis]